MAIENSDSDFKAVWAEPRGNKNRDDNRRNHSDGDRRRDDSWERGRDRFERVPEREFRGGRDRDRDYDSYEYTWKPPRTEYTPPGNSSFVQASVSSGYEEVLQQFSVGSSVPSNATSRLQVDVTGRLRTATLSSL
ncbi:hypothetical protein BSL78_21239 [Apostichopus japonicus]|uniref:Uncharacterized protein n=1 Tax=Stichopus japonicus TaxID=307972 RepID=A0A2G8K1N4_STIJA|nr:hypothetical protein BSL78_21239 [Apostichopus japonicus]